MDEDDISRPTPIEFITDSPTSTTTFKLTRPTTTLARHPRPSPINGTTTTSQNHNAAEKWRVPTILVLTISVALGIAMMLFLMWVAYRKVKKLRALRRQEMAQRL